jgi:signal transduction histidine kinase
MNDVLGLFLLMLLVDWVSFIFLVTLGIGLGWLCYWMTGGELLYPISKEALSLAVYMYIFAILIGGIFSRSKEKVIAEKFLTIKSLSATMAHELRTPLRTIISSAKGIKKYFPTLLAGYQAAEHNNLIADHIDPIHYNALATSCDDIETEAESAFTVINMLLIKVREPSVSPDELELCSMSACINEALARYPFAAGEKALVHWQGIDDINDINDIPDTSTNPTNSNDFKFYGNSLLIIHVIFNLLKNSLYYIHAANKGEVTIWLEKKPKENILHFKDTAKGISPKHLPYIFDRFFTQTPHGTGIGLAFCKMAVENMGGSIQCFSKEGEYAEFVLKFPVV